MMQQEMSGMRVDVGVVPFEALDRSDDFSVWAYLATLGGAAVSGVFFSVGGWVCLRAMVALLLRLSQ